jgi:hypothetical protein
MNDKLERVWEEAVITSSITIPEFPRSDSGKLPKSSVRITGVPTKIRIEHLLNTSLEHNYCVITLGT